MNIFSAKHILLCFLLLSVVSQISWAEPGKDAVIRGTTIVDVDQGTLLQDRDVLLKGGRIAEITDAGRATSVGDAQIIDGRGSYLIPGLWDMHIHPFGAQNLNTTASMLGLLLANGVTGIRDPGVINGKIKSQVMTQIAGGELYSPPRIYDGVSIIADTTKPGFTQVSSAQQGREAVGHLAKQGAAFIKVHTTLPPEAYFAVAEQAKAVGLPLIGHVPWTVAAGEASDNGQLTIEHFMGVMLGCTGEEQAALDTLNRIYRPNAGEADQDEQSAAWRARRLVAHDSPLELATCERLLRRLSANGTWQTPTLISGAKFAQANEAEFAADERLQYVPAELKGFWQGGVRWLESDRAANTRWYQRHTEIAALLEKTGSLLLVGSDAPAIPLVIPGFSVHEEMQLLTEQGLSNLYVLQAATINPAKVLRVEDRLGSVAEGKLADLVLLEGNPLEDIRNTQKIRAVIADGRVLQRSDLDALFVKIRDDSAAGQKIKTKE